MSNFWTRLIRRFILEPPVPESVPPPMPAVGLSPNPVLLGPNPPLGMPQSFYAASGGEERPRIFDPALRHFRSAFRPGDPAFADEADVREWVQLRRLAMDHVLRRVSESAWGNVLILRGSRLMKAWMSESREPGDLDWIFEPASRQSSDQFFEELPDLVCDGFDHPRLKWLKHGIIIEEIWAYERAPGRRVVIPWRCEGLPGAAVQIDVVSNEPLADPARIATVLAADGGCITLRCASPAQSLAWKLLWLVSDMSPQGKDAYDAMLLAERFPMPRPILDRTFANAASEESAQPEMLNHLRDSSSIDWEEFKREYPWITNAGQHLIDRLATALAPIFAAPQVMEAGVASSRRRRPPWVTENNLSLAMCIRNERAWDRLPFLADALDDAGCDDVDVLQHCRSHGRHRDGCAVLDRLIDDEAI